MGSLARNAAQLSVLPTRCLALKERTQTGANCQIHAYLLNIQGLRYQATPFRHANHFVRPHVLQPTSIAQSYVTQMAANWKVRAYLLKGHQDLKALPAHHYAQLYVLPTSSLAQEEWTQMAANFQTHAYLFMGP